MNGCLGGSQRRCQHSRLHHRLEPLDEPRGELPLALHIGQMLFLQALFEQRPGEEVGTGVLATAGGLVFYGQPNGGFAAVDESTGKTLWRSETNARMKASPYRPYSLIRS